MKNCVNTSHKEFKELARKLDIEDSFLRTIIYEFQNADPTNVNVFPSEEYIIQKLTGINPITSPAQMALWEKYYFEVLKFDSEKKFDAALENAKKFFPSRAITTWKTRDGKIALKVAEPNNYRENLYEEEIQDILAKAPRDKEGRLLAPNGKPSNLTERQYAQVRTKAFKEWFGVWINPYNEDILIWNHQMLMDLVL